MDYTSIILEAFTTDLLKRKDAGATDVWFDGKTQSMTIRHIGTEQMTQETGIPALLLRHIVETIFGQERKGSRIWRGYQMSAQTLIDSKNKNCYDKLMVRLTTPERAKIEK